MQWWDNLISRGEQEFDPDFDGVPWLIFAVVALMLLAVVYGLFQAEAAFSVEARA